jgi:hypothetical protein
MEQLAPVEGDKQCLKHIKRLASHRGRIASVYSYIDHVSRESDRRQTMRLRGIENESKKDGIQCMVARPQSETIRIEGVVKGNEKNDGILKVPTQGEDTEI